MEAIRPVTSHIKGMDVYFILTNQHDDGTPLKEPQFIVSIGGVTIANIKLNDMKDWFDIWYPQFYLT